MTMSTHVPNLRRLHLRHLLLPRLVGSYTVWRLPGQQRYSGSCLKFRDRQVCRLSRHTPTLLHDGVDPSIAATMLFDSRAALFPLFWRRNSYDGDLLGIPRLELQASEILIRSALGTAVHSPADGTWSPAPLHLPVTVSFTTVTSGKSSIIARASSAGGDSLLG